MALIAGHVRGYLAPTNVCIRYRGVQKIIGTDVSKERCDAMSVRYRGKPVDISLVAPGDNAVLGESADIVVRVENWGTLSPCCALSESVCVLRGAPGTQRTGWDHQ